MGVYKRKSRAGKRSRFFTAGFEYRGKRYIKGGFVDRESASYWLNAEINRLRRGAVGFVKPMLQSKVIPLIEQFCDSMAAKGRDEKYVEVYRYRLNRLARDCGWLTLGNVDRASVERWLESEQIYKNRKINARTKNQYLATAFGWGKWLSSSSIARLAVNPFAGMDRLSAKHNDEFRRAGTIDELNKVLATCSASHRRFYIFRVYTPMRGRTIGKLTWRMMHLDVAHPFALTPAEWNKSRKPVKHPIRIEVAQGLRTARKRAKLDDLVFPDAPTLDEFRDDLQAAGVTFCDANGNNRLDYHALRTTLVQIGKQAGLTAWQMKDLIGWKTMATMEKHYDKLAIEPDRADTMAKLPSIGQVRRAE